jgi:cytochrome c-type biogenesis protein CcmH/NrfG
MPKHIAKQETAESRPTWTQAYVMATFCLVLGVTLGYLLRGSAAPISPNAATSTGTSAAPNASPFASGTTPPGPQSKSALDAAAAPMLANLKSNPSDFDTLVRLGNLYYDGQSYPEAIQYYGQALKVRPDAVDVRTDMGTAYWYSGNADRALQEFAQSLKTRPGHAQSLFNTGIVRWQGKNDAPGAVAAWEELLQKNPSYPEREKVQQLMAQAKQGR